MVLEAATEPLLHPLGQGATTLRGGRTARRSSAPSLAGNAVREDRDDGTGKHHQETENADDRDPDRAEGEHDTSDKKQQAQYKKGDSLDPATVRPAAHPGTPDVRRELGVLCIERALNLVEQTLLVLGEWHRLLLRHSGLSILVSDSDGSSGYRTPTVGS
jgi:hypothetical protein